MRRSHVRRANAAQPRATRRRLRPARPKPGLGWQTLVWPAFLRSRTRRARGCQALRCASALHGEAGSGALDAVGPHGRARERRTSTPRRPQDQGPLHTRGMRGCRQARMARGLRRVRRPARWRGREGCPAQNGCVGGVKRINGCGGAGKGREHGIATRLPAWPSRTAAQDRLRPNTRDCSRRGPTALQHTGLNCLRCRHALSSRLGSN